MKQLVPFVLIIAWLLQSCTGTRRFGTTIERDEDNICQTNMVIQIGIQGTDDDVTAVRSSMERCFAEECFIPCPDDSTKGCKTTIKVVVKKWSDIKEDEQIGFHYVLMVDEDGLPSNVYIGRPNVSTPGESCTWRRGAFGNTYCHEVLHLCGLPDRYCSRIYDPVLDSVITELTCAPDPEPNVNCCVPGAGFSRCSEPCAGHHDDIMGSSLNPVTCTNIKDVLGRAGFGDCPEACCKSDKTFTRPPDEVYIMPGYLNFGDKGNKFGTLGIGVGYEKKISTGLGIGIDAGIYLKTEKQEDIKRTETLIPVTGGVSYTPGKAPTTATGLFFTSHLYAGVMIYKQRVIVSGEGIGETNTSFCLKAGAAVNWKLNPSFSIRLLQADYMPTFFGEETQHNFRLSAGLVYRFVGRR